jgi:hypothetical protein
LSKWPFASRYPEDVLPKVSDAGGGKVFDQLSYWVSPGRLHSDTEALHEVRLAIDGLHACALENRVEI